MEKQRREGKKGAEKNEAVRTRGIGGRVVGKPFFTKAVAVGKKGRIPKEGERKQVKSSRRLEYIRNGKWRKKKG